MEGLRHPHKLHSGFNHSVSRSNELLSCAKTSRKLLEQQQNERNNDSHVPAPPIKLNLRLALISGPSPLSLVILEDGLTLLRAMEYGTKKLQILVRRRGHTNDPTQEIDTLVKQLEQDMQELTSFCEQVLKIRRRKQEKRHWELVVQWFQRVANHYSSQLQDCLKLRGEILAEQAQKRRKLVESSGKSKANTLSKGTKDAAASATASAAATPLFGSPLFTAKPRTTTTVNQTYANRQHQQQLNNGNLQPTANESAVSRNSSSSSAYYRGNTTATDNAAGAGRKEYDRRTGGLGATYGATSFGYTGYGSVGVGYGHSGMRQRKAGNSASSNIPVQEQEEEEKVHTQIQMRERKRQTQQRLDEARQAESTLSEVAKLYGKMSTLITQQGETLEKIEDDVESALVDVSAGQEELTKLYSIKKGNRPLIVKTFFILNFLVIFMRTYYKK